MILHIDMDAYYASVEEREDPTLKGKPVIVGGRAEARGVVAAANYASRKFGIHSAMPTATAVKKCPSLIIIKPRGDLYSIISKQIREIFYRYTPIIESLSLDEAFLDPRGSERLYGSAVEIGKGIKNDIKNELDLVASVGVAPSKFIAKLASDYDKPDGFTVVNPEHVQQFLDPLPVGRIWGVGKAANTKLATNGIRTVAELRTRSVEFLDKLFGQYGEQLWRLAHGIDEREVTPDSEVKSVSQETTFELDIASFSSIESTALYLTEGVCFRLRESELKGKTITIKIRYDDFKTITRSRSLDNRTHQTNEIWKAVKTLLEETLSNQKFSIRLIGVGVANFSQELPKQGSGQIDIFSVLPEAQSENPLETNSIDNSSSKGQVLDRLSDEIKHRFGNESVKRGKSTSTNKIQIRTNKDNS